MNGPRGLHVVLGTGPLGLAVARHLAGRGERVRAVTRSGRADLPDGVEVGAADVAQAAEVERAIERPPCTTVPTPVCEVGGAPPPMMESIIKGAAAEARLVFAPDQIDSGHGRGA